MLFHPDLLPKTVDSQGSTRHNYIIIYEKIHGAECVTYYDDIDANHRFIIEDYSPNYKGYEVHMFEGVVLREQNSSSWWRKIIDKGE